MKALRMLFIVMVVIVQFFASVVVTLSSEQILTALSTPQTLAGLISGSVSVIIMMIMMAGLFLPQFDRMTHLIDLMQAARDIVERVQDNEYVDPREFDRLGSMLQRHSMEVTVPSRRTYAAPRRPTGGGPAGPGRDWPYDR